MFKHCLNMEITKKVSRWGNSAGVLLPRELLGSIVKISIINTRKSIKEEVFEILSSYLDEILGIYLTGSYARGEQNADSDIDIVVISNTLKKEIKSGKYNISIYPLSALKKTIKINPILVLPRLREAKTILNSNLLSELNSISIKRKSFNYFIEECRRIIKIDEEFIKLDKAESDELKSESVIYSLILRLRGIFLINCILNNKDYTKRDFDKYLSNELGKQRSRTAYAIYSQIRDDERVQPKINIETAESLLSLLKKEVRKYGKSEEKT